MVDGLDETMQNPIYFSSVFNAECNLAFSSRI